MIFFPSIFVYLVEMLVLLGKTLLLHLGPEFPGLHCPRNLVGHQVLGEGQVDEVLFLNLFQNEHDDDYNRGTKVEVEEEGESVSLHVDPGKNNVEDVVGEVEVVEGVENNVCGRGAENVLYLSLNHSPNGKGPEVVRVVLGQGNRLEE